jgi:hypothetical protein
MSINNHLVSLNFSTRRLSFVDKNKTPMDTSNKTVHRGEIVKGVVDKSYLKVTQISHLVDRSRSQLYKDFDNPEMDWAVISKIGNAIKHDFSEDFPELTMYENAMVQEPTARYIKDGDIELALSEIDKWKTEAYKNLAEANKWKDLYYELALTTGKLQKVS